MSNIVFTQKQLQTLKEGFAREKMQQASQQPRVKKPRIHTTHYERADIATLISESTMINNDTKNALLRNIDKLEIVSIKRPFTYVFGKKTYINESDMKYYEGFTIYYE